jgi:hypothetical protein
VLHRSFASEANGQVSLGNHAAVRVADGRAEPLAHAAIQDVFLAHYPVRSPQQVARKALIGWLAHRLTMPERFLGDKASAANVPASHWRDIFERLANGTLEIDARLLERSIIAYAGGESPVAREELVEDPLPAPYALRYTAPSAAASALAALATWADQLVSDVNAGRIADPGRR